MERLNLQCKTDRDAEADTEFEITEEKDDDDIRSVENQGIV